MLVVCIHCHREQDHPLAEIHEELGRIRRLIEMKGSAIMSALTNLQTADQDLKDEVVVVLERLAGQVQGGLTEEEGNAIADDINAQVAALKSATDPAPAPVEEPPAA